MKALQSDKHAKLLTALVLIALIGSISIIVSSYEQSRSKTAGVTPASAVTIKAIKVEPISPTPAVTLVVVSLPSPPEVTLEVVPLSSPTPTTVISNDFNENLLTLCGVAYAPTNFDAEKGIFPPEESVKKDLEVLRGAGFNGLVTYGADEVIHRVAEEVGFEAMILGVWDPTSQEELNIAKEAAQYSVIIGYVVGNEGLNKRYDYNTLKAAMDELRQASSKPVTTTEEWGDYRDPQVMDLGDWVFPNVHPYWHGITDPQQAVHWTVEHFRELTEQTDKPVVFKEVGLPSGGDPGVDEAKQAEYYRLLSDTAVAFVYFEAYDQPWKQWAPVEPYWGLFRQDRSPKPVASSVCPSKGSELSSIREGEFVTCEGSKLMLGGQEFRFLGNNAYFLQPEIVYGNMAGVEEVLDEMVALGMSVVRTIGFNDHDPVQDPAVIQISPGVYNEQSLVALDRVIAEAKARNIRLILYLTNNWDAYGGINRYVQWYEEQCNCEAHHDDFYTSETIKGWYKDYIRMLLNRTNTITGVRYKDEPAILAWELGNELRNERGDAALLLDWVEEMAAYIKSIDPNHLVADGVKASTMTAACIPG